MCDLMEFRLLCFRFFPFCLLCFLALRFNVVSQLCPVFCCCNFACVEFSFFFFLSLSLSLSLSLCLPVCFLWLCVLVFFVACVCLLLFGFLLFPDLFAHFQFPVPFSSAAVSCFCAFVFCVSLPGCVGRLCCSFGN